VLIAASTPVQPIAPLLTDQVRAARAEQSAAEAEATKLEAIAARAKGAAARLAAEQAAAAQSIDAAEARITAAEAELGLASARLAAYRRALQVAQRPVSALLAGLAMLGQRPPILALADRGGVDELVKTRILLKATMPVLRRRSSALAAQIERGQQMEQAAASARAALLAGRQGLVVRQQRFAALEQRALAATLASGGAALLAGDRAIAGRESLAELAAKGRGSAALVAELIAIGPAPARPGPTDGLKVGVPFTYDLPAEARVTRGLAEIDRGGVRSPGLVLATEQGAQLRVPADGTLRFSGPFRDHDGIVIIDHGKGWNSLIVNLASPLPVGRSVKRGEPLGRALGPIEVELSHNGRRQSPAIIAGSSKTLSNKPKGG
jgi:septal ring factor EnvC (AmiA/AmiB activator)